MKIKSKKSALLVCGLSASILLSGCASMFGDNSRTVSVNSQPEGASILVNGQQYGTTPATITLPTYIYNAQVITLKMAGYANTTTVVNSEFQPVGLLDLFFWPGFIIDGATGNSVKIVPSERTINLAMNTNS